MDGHNRYHILQKRPEVRFGIYKTGRCIVFIEKQQYHRGQIYYADMEPHVGSEQGGARPVVVLQNNIGNRYAPTLIVATITSKVNKKDDLPTHIRVDQNTGLSAASIVQLEQLFTIDKRRIRCFVGQMSETDMERIEQALRCSLGLTDAPKGVII